MDKQNVVYTHNGILFGHRRNEVLNHATTCMNLENITLSEISQTQRTNIIRFHVYEISRIGR